MIDHSLIESVHRHRDAGVPRDRRHLARRARERLAPILMTTLAALAGKAFDEAESAERQKAVDAGNTITVIPEENLAEWREASQPVIDAWVKTMTDAGHDGQAMLDDARAMLDKARAQ